MHARGLPRFARSVIIPHSTRKVNTLFKLFSDFFKNGNLHNKMSDTTDLYNNFALTKIDKQLRKWYNNDVNIYTRAV